MLLQTKLTSWAQRDTTSGKHHIHRLEEKKLGYSDPSVKPTIELGVRIKRVSLKQGLAVLKIKIII